MISATEKSLRALLAERIVLLDGAMGTMIQQYKLQEADYRGDRFADWTGQDLKGNNDLLVLTKPEIVREVHSKYIAAGSDIIETNTFNATTISQEDYGLGHLVAELNLAAARLARGEVVAASDEIDDRVVLRPLEQSVHREVAARSVLFQRAPDIVPKNEPRIGM